jgi:tripartite-type tricarboxylate transporter receptor subunit TctC
MKISLKHSLVILSLLGSSFAHAQKFPSNPVTMVVPFAAGGPTDTVSRVVAQAMATALKQPVNVENAGGAGGTTGAAKVAKAAPDGYTILMHHIGHATAPSLYRKLSYSPVDNFEPIGLVTEVPMTLVARSNFPAKNINELLAYLKANKDKVSYAHAGLGSASQLCGMLFMRATDTELTVLPYTGTGPAMNDLLGGQVDVMCDQITNTLSQIKSGKIKAYGVTTKTKVAALNTLPPLSEAGMPGFEITVWHGLYAPKGTPKAVIDTLAAALQTALKDPAVKQHFAELGIEPVSAKRATPEALRAHLRAELDRWGPIIVKAGAYAD